MQHYSGYSILAVIIMGLILRLVGLEHGLPFALRSDEEVVIGGAMKMLQLKTLVPALYPQEFEISYYPPFLTYFKLLGITPFVAMLYVHEGLPDSHLFYQTVYENMGNIFLSARIVACVSSTILIFLTYKISRLIFKSQSIALFASILIATDFLSVFTGHFARHWNLTTLFIWLTVYYAIKIHISGKMRDYILASVASGVGFGISYAYGAWGFIAVVFCHFLRQYKNISMLNGKLFLCICILVFLSMLSVILFPQPFFRLMYGKAATLNDTKSFIEFIFIFVEYVRVLFWSNPVLTIICLGTAFCLRTHQEKMLGLTFFLFTLLYVAMLYLTVTFEDRYLIGIIPAFCLFGSIGLGKLSKVLIHFYPKFRFKIIISMTVLIAFYPAILATYSNLLLLRDDTRLQAIEWVHNNLKDQDKIVNDMHHVRLKSSNEALAYQKQIDPYSLTSFERYRLSQKNMNLQKYSMSSINISWIKFNNNDTRTELIAKRLQSDNYAFFIFQKRPDQEESALKQHLAPNLKKITEFKPSQQKTVPPYLHSTQLVIYPMYHLFFVDRFGPHVEIFQLINKNSNV